MGTARVQARGQVTIPQDIRDECGIEPGDDLYFTVGADNVIHCYVLPRPLPLEELLEKYSQPGPAPDIDELRKQAARELVERKFSFVLEPEEAPA
jgi:AbrB family looped-hinge helix DNA binding protein